MNQLETRELAYFVAVAETLHFGQAAENLGITQPPLSRAIAQLERRVGVPLLERTTRRVSLTAAGEIFLAECRTILAALDTAVRKARKAAEQQRVTIAARPAAAPGILPALLAAGPQGPDGVHMEVVFTYDEIGALRDGTADVALMCQSIAAPGLELMELGPEEPVVLLPAGHPLAERPFLTLTEVEALAGYEADLPNEALDVMVDRVALGRLVVIVGDSVSDRLGGTVRAVPVYGYPTTQLVLAWLPDAHPAASRLTATAHAVMERRTPRAGQSAGGRPKLPLGQSDSADRQPGLHQRAQPSS